MTMLLRRKMLIPQSRDWRDLYQQVAYLEVPSNGGANNNPYIDTGVIPTVNIVSQIKFLNKAVTGDAIYGFQKSAGDAFKYRFFNFSQQLYFDFPTNNVGTYRLHPTNPTVPITTDTIYELELGTRYVKDLATGTMLASDGSATFVSGITDTITTGYNYTNSTVSKNIWYYVKIYDGETLIRDMIPCYRKSDNKPGMYDTVNGTFYTNAGTGEFVVGPDVTPEGYIKSGLVLWLDGVDKGDNSSLWPDKCGSYDFTLSNCTFGTNGVVFNGSTSRGSNNGGFGVSISSATIEYCIDMNTDNGEFTNGCVLSPTQGNSRYNIGAEVRYEDENHLFGMTAIDFRSTDGYRALPTASISNKIIFSASVSASSSSEHVNTGINMFNGISGTWGNPATFTPNNSNTETTIGARHRNTMSPGWNMIFKGTIYAIRIYNRQLTAAEMLHNQRIDNARYNMGLTI